MTCSPSSKQMLITIIYKPLPAHITKKILLKPGWTIVYPFLWTYLTLGNNLLVSNLLLLRLKTSKWISPIFNNNRLRLIVKKNFFVILFVQPSKFEFFSTDFVWVCFSERVQQKTDANSWDKNGLGHHFWTGWKANILQLKNFIKKTYFIFFPRGREKTQHREKLLCPRNTFGVIYPCYT